KDIPCKIQNDHALFHEADGVLVDHSLGIVERGYMYRNIITLFVKFINSGSMMNAARKSPGRIHGNIWIVSIDLHSEMNCRVGHQNSDGTQSDHTQFLTLELCSGKSFLLLF